MLQILNIKTIDFINILWPFFVILIFKKNIKMTKKIFFSFLIINIPLICGFLGMIGTDNNVIAKTYLKENVYLTHYNDTGNNTHSGLGIKDLELNENGWYTYNGMVAVATATNACIELTAGKGGCVNYNTKQKEITYYDFGDTFTLKIDGKKYKAVVVDSCGPCMNIKKIKDNECRNRNIVDIFSDSNNKKFKFDTTSGVIVSHGEKVKLSKKKTTTANNSQEDNNTTDSDSQEDNDTTGLLGEGHTYKYGQCSPTDEGYDGQYENGYIYKRFENTLLNYDYTVAEMEEKIANIIQKIFDAVLDAYGEPNYCTSSSSSAGDSCTYNKILNGKKTDVSNIKVRLLQCRQGNESGKEDDPVPGDLINFEDYVLGVVHQEIGSTLPEAVKAQAIATRTYSLTSSNIKWKKNGDGWILEVHSCTDAQVYCDPYKGCHSATGVDNFNSDWCYTNPTGKGGTCKSTVYPGTKKGANLWNKAAFNEKNAKDRQVMEAVRSTAGIVALSPKGNTAGISYGSTESSAFHDMAEEGKTAEEILKSVYSASSGNVEIASLSEPNCSSTTTGYIWPIGNAKTNQKNNKTFALGTPSATTISSPFGNRVINGTKGSHGGIDISSDGKGNGYHNVVATASGKVIYPIQKSQTQYKDNRGYGNRDGGGYGNFVKIKHDDGTITYYGHMAKNSIIVMKGDTVEQGQVIGKMGNSGNSTGTHLHFEMRIGGDGKKNRVDPQKYVKATK